MRPNGTNLNTVGGIPISPVLCSPTNGDDQSHPTPERDDHRESRPPSDLSPAEKLTVLLRRKVSPGRKRLFDQIVTSAANAKPADFLRIPDDVMGEERADMEAAIDELRENHPDWFDEGDRLS